jgi:hypothetical protein
MMLTNNTALVRAFTGTSFRWRAFLLATPHAARAAARNGSWYSNGSIHRTDAVCTSYNINNNVHKTDEDPPAFMTSTLHEPVAGSFDI